MMILMMVKVIIDDDDDGDVDCDDDEHGNSDGMMAMTMMAIVICVSRSPPAWMKQSQPGAQSGSMLNSTHPTGLVDKSYILV